MTRRFLRRHFNRRSHSGGQTREVSVLQNNAFMLRAALGVFPFLDVVVDAGRELSLTDAFGEFLEQPAGVELNGQERLRQCQRYNRASLAPAHNLWIERVMRVAGNVAPDTAR